jgi:hypothetical protein
MADNQSDVPANAGQSHTVVARLGERVWGNIPNDGGKYYIHLA